MLHCLFIHRAPSISSQKPDKKVAGRHKGRPPPFESKSPSVAVTLLQRPKIEEK